MLTEEMLRMVEAVASKYAARAKLLHRDMDDIKGEAYLALVAADARFDPAKSPNGEEGRAFFLSQAVCWSVKNSVFGRGERGRKVLAFRASMGSLDRPLGRDRFGREFNGGRFAWREPPPAAFELMDEANHRLACLDAHSKRVVLMLWRDGLSKRDVSGRIGVTRERVRQIEKRARERLLEARGRRESRGG